MKEGPATTLNLQPKMDTTSPDSVIVEVPRREQWEGKRLWQVLVGLCILYTLVTGAYTFRASLLRGSAKAWIVSNPCTNADAIVVLGGGLEYRTFAAAELYRAGVAPKILIAQPQPWPTEQMGLRLPESVLARYVLLSNGVPASAIEMMGTNVTSTRDEALALRGWVDDRKAEKAEQQAKHRMEKGDSTSDPQGEDKVSVVIPTDIFHTRRARWIFSRALKGTDAEVHLVAIEPKRYQSTNWWHHEDGIIAFQNEVLKSMYYHLKY